MLQDPRTQITDLAGPPFTGICLLQARYSGFAGVVGYGTGFLVEPGRLATAGHVIWNDLDGAATSPLYPDFLDVFLGDGLYHENTHLSWTFSFPTTAITVHSEFLAGDDTYDIAKITLPQQMTGVLSLVDFPGILQVGDEVTISGYPTACSPFGEWEASGVLNSTDLPLFQHRVETSVGQSGAPVRLYRDGTWVVVGIHLSANEGAGAGVNNAAAITPTIREWLLS